MELQDKFLSSNKCTLFNDKINIQVKQDKKYTPTKTINNISSLTKLKQTSLENELKKLDKEKINTKIPITSNIKYGIDETGNPINIKEYYKSINDSVNLNSNSSIFTGITSINQKLKKPIAYITKDENNNNILIDLQGNKITSKNKDGDYDLSLKLHVIIKDFDVKHPELRVNGERSYKDDIKENIDITKEINEKEKDVFGDNLNNINYNNEIYGLNGHSCLNLEMYNPNKENKYILPIFPIMKKPMTNKSIKNKMICRKNTYNFQDNFLKRYKNINILEANNNTNEVVLRTSDILNNSNSPSSTNINNNMNIRRDYSKIEDHRFLGKNRSFNGPILRNNTSNLLSFRFKRGLSDNHKIENNLKSKIRTIKSSLNINNLGSKYIRRNNININKNKKYKNRNQINIFNEKLNTEININNTKLNNIYPNIIKPEKNIIQRRLNKYSNNNIYTDTSQFDNNNNIFKTMSYNYFIIKHNKSFNNSKFFKNNEKKEDAYKKINKKSTYIPINEDNKNNLAINILKNSKIKAYTKSKLNNSAKNKNKKNTDNNKIMSYKIKKIIIPKRERILKIQKSTYEINNPDKNYILSEEANDMIKSFSKKKINKENNKINNKEISPNNFKNKILNILSNQNSTNRFNNSIFSIMNKNKSKKSESNIKTVDKKSQKCLGITVSLPNNVSNRNKVLKTSTNNQININFTPYQIKCESLIKNNDENKQQNKQNEKKVLSDLKDKNNYNIKKNFVSTNYELYF